MTTKVTISSGDQASSASPALTPLLLGCCEKGVVGGVGGASYAFDPGDDVAATLGGGTLSDAVLYMLRETGGRVLAQPATPTWSAAPTVTQSGTGPAISCALTNGALGCLDAHTIVITIKVAGVGGAAQADVAYDGSTVLETIPIPAEPPAVIRGVIDLAALTYPYATLDTKHLDFTAPAAKVITFAGSYASPQAIIDGFNALAAAAPFAVRARLAQDSSGHSYMELYSTAGGAGVTVTIDASASDADALLGFTLAALTLTATGAAATLAFPFTGLTFTFPSGAYKKDEVYTASCVGPRASLGALNAAAVAGHGDYQNSPFGFMVVAQPADTAANCAATATALSTLCKGWIADTAKPIFVTCVVGAPFHTASATLATNDANIALADAALLAAMANVAANPDNVATEDCYIPGANSLRSGLYRRTAALAWGVKRASAAKLAADVGDGLVPEATLLGPDGRTRARDDSRATTKLQGGGGPGFAALKSTKKLSLVKFGPGATRAGPTSRLRYAGAYGVGLAIAGIVWEEVDPWDAKTIPADPLTGQMSPHEKKKREDYLTALLAPTLTPDGQEPNVSAFTVSLPNPPTGTFLNQGKVPVRVAYIPLGEVEAVTVDITAIGTVTVSA